MKRRVVFDWIFLAIMAFSFQNVVCQDRLADKKITINKDIAAFGEVLEILMEEYDVAFGFEQSLDLNIREYDFETNLAYELPTKDGVQIPPTIKYEQNSLKLKLNFDSAKLTEVLDSIVSQMPGYKWEINDQVVNFVPSKNRNEIFEKLLHVKVSKFKVERPYIFLIQNELLEVPELNAFLKNNNLCISNIGGINRVSTHRKLETEMNFSDLTFRQLLNRITSVKRGGWILRRYRYQNDKECLVVLI